MEERRTRERRTLSKSPISFFKEERRLRAISLAAFWASSGVTSAPTLPVMSLPSASVGRWPAV